MNAIEQLKSVLCDPDGKCCILGSEEDRAIVDRALQALAAPVQEPVAWRWVNPKGWLTYGEAPHDTFKSTPLYTNPPTEQRQWVGLSQDEVTICHSLAVLSKKHDGTDPSFTTLLHQQIEAKLKEKNAAAQPEQEEDLYDLAVKADNWGQP
jgi:hypothetical protein